MDTSSTLHAAGAQRATVDCSQCPTTQRCWGGVVPSNAGFRVRREGCSGAGETLFAQGDIFAAIYFVRSGCLKLSETLEDGIDRVVGFRLPGEIVGLEGLSSGRYPYRAEALMPASACRLQWTGTVPDILNCCNGYSRRP